MIYQSFSGDASVGTSTFTMTGGELTATAGPIFCSTNIDAVINLKSASLKENTGILLNADGQMLPGSITGDGLNKVSVGLKNGSTLVGAVNADGRLEFAALTMDSASKWSVTADSYLTSLTDGDETLANIDDKIYPSLRCLNGWLGGRTLALKEGGKLTPGK